jgi:nucleoid-associated protein YgaU
MLDAAENTTDWGVHVLLEDERLSQLAARYYGYPDMWRLIAIANNFDNPLSLLPGMRLRIPPLSVLQ